LVHYTDQTTVYQNYTKYLLDGAFSFISVAVAMGLFPEYEGYLFVQDDLIIKPWTMVDLDKNRVWNVQGPYPKVAPGFIIDIAQDPGYWGIWKSDFYWESSKAAYKLYSEADKAKIKQKYGNSTTFVRMWR
jgi:hypothetical protein